jgi:hypothetical protein
MRASPAFTVLVAATLSLVGCLPDFPDDETPPPSQFPAIYRISPTWCTGHCWTLTLHRSDTSIELRAHEPDGTFLGLATGSLNEPASDELDQLLESVDLGELPADGPIDSPLIEMWLPGLSLSYDHGYPPSGLVEIDAFLATVLDDMSQCRPTTKVTPDWDCEPLNWYPD